VTLADVNVLIYAFRPEALLHTTCKRWLDSVVLGNARFGVSPLALSAVARILTNSRAYSPANTPEQVFAFCDNLLGQPNCEVVEPGRRHWAIFKRICVEAKVRGPMMSDAWYAALAIESGCTWITCDRDFARFPGLDWSEPGG